MNLRKIINSVEYILLGCSIMILGCICLIWVYLFGFIGVLLVVIIILYLVVKKHNIHRRLLEEKNKREKYRIN